MKSVYTPWYNTHWIRISMALLALFAIIGFARIIWMSQRIPPPLAAATTPLDTTTQINDAGQITIKATWQGVMAGPVFTIVMDTHAVDLDGYDLSTLAVLRTDTSANIAPVSWDAPPGGHHRQGTLRFPTTTADGNPLITAETRTLTLVLSTIGDVPERSFTWTR